MVNKRYEPTNQDDLEITTEMEEHHDPDLADVEATEKDIISSLKKKLKHSEEEKRQALEDTQRAKADFLNARKRLEDERVRDRERSVIHHIEELIPLCDSFHMAMNNQAWDKADPTWRKGIEGIYAQLERLLTQYRVTLLKPQPGEVFDPRKHEALSTLPVTDKTMHDTVIHTIQAGYEITHGNGSTELIRPARVSIGAFEA